MKVSLVATAKSLQLCQTLCDPIDVGPPGSPAPGILQARTLEWVAIFFSNAWKWKSESEVAQSCPTLREPMDCSLPGSSLGISYFLEEISSLFHFIVFLCFFALITEEGFLISPCYSLELCIQVGISFLFSFACKVKVKVKSLSCVWLFATPWKVTYQAPQSMGFSRQEYWSGLPFTSPGDLPNPGIEPRSPALQTDALLSEPLGKPFAFSFSPFLSYL